MVVNNIVEQLVTLGYSEYEAKAYLALLAVQPATAYEVARHAALPTSKIYQVMNRLTQKGLAQMLKEAEKVRYIPLEPTEFINREQSKINQILSSLQTELDELKKESDLSTIWNVRQYEYLLTKSRQMIAGAQKQILLSIWPKELTALLPDLQQSLTRQVKIAIVYFGHPDSLPEGVKTNEPGQLFLHPIQDTLYEEKGGRSLVAVCDAADKSAESEALMGTIYPDEQVDGAWSMNKGFVTLAEDYIKHDIYIMKIVQRFDALLIERFGFNYKKLRDIFSDEEFTPCEQNQVDKARMKNKEILQ